MNVNNYYHIGGEFIERMDVHGNIINVYSDSQTGCNLKKEGTFTVDERNTVKDVKMSEITPEMIKTAAKAALIFQDDRGRDVFIFSYMWQSVYRILKDMKLTSTYTAFTTRIQTLFTREELKKMGKERLYLTDPTNFSQKDVGIYAQPFSNWKEKDDLTGLADPRYLIAKEFKTVLDGLRTAEGIKQNSVVG